MAERKSLLLRLNPALYEEIQRLAAEDLRSVNGEIEYLLREAVERRRRRPLKEEKTESD
jgi:hypothetical protein